MVDKLKDNDKQAKALCSLGDLNLAKEDFDKALSYFERYLRVSRRLDEYETECRAFLKIGDVFKSQGRHQHAQYYYEMAAAVGEKLNDNVDLVNLCRCEVAFALTLSISKDDMERARLVFDELIPFYTKKIQKCDSESIECADELKTALQNCYDGVQIALCKLDQADMALSYAEGYRQQKFEQILKQKLSTDEEEPRNENETSKMPSQEELIKIVNRQKATVLYYSITDAYLLVWVLQPDKGVVKVQVEKAIRESCRKKIRSALEQLQQLHERQSDIDCENRALPSSDRTVQYLQRKNLAKSKEWKSKEMKKDAEREERLKTAKLSPQRQLYDIIIAPIEKSLTGVEQVLIIPDKEISQVPVDLLENEKNVKLNATFKISCVPSIAVLDVLTKQTQHEEREQKAKKSYHEFFPVYLDDHLRVVVPPDQRPLSPIRKQLRAGAADGPGKEHNPSMITFGTNHYDYVPTPRHRQDKAQVILARERAKVGTLITHSSTDTEVSKGEGAVTEFKQDSLQHKSLSLEIRFYQRN
ncbi:tetratricopeptide repeat protein 28-like isoform X1 [Ptychodera flava]|uniref:tetratricopeptide repeat protein 28-like isoform X1 n=1 Tax=Ptychodera flava TaxID=63121 RepID=UPI00396A413E